MTQTQVRGGAVAAAIVVLTLLVTQFLFPDGTPMAVLFMGLTTGLLNALLAISIVFIFRSHRFINFAAAALGGAGAIFTYNLTVLNNWPFPISFILGLAVSAGVGLAFEMAFVRRFFNAPRLVLTVLTIALIQGLGFLNGYVNSLPIFQGVEDRTVEELAGRSITLPFKNFEFTIGDLPLKFGFKELFAIGMAIAAMAALATFLRYSKSGIAVRAAAENAERASLLGVSVGALSMLSWTIAGLLGGTAVILQSTVTQSFNRGTGDPALILVALAAAVFAKMKSMPIAAYAAIVITLFQNSFDYAFESQSGLVYVVLFVLLLVSLVYVGVGSKGRRSEESEASSWKATEEFRPIPREMLEVPGVRRARLALLILGLGAVILLPFVSSTRVANLGGYYALITIALLSLTVLTGWAGQVSLGQGALLAFGAVVGAAFTAKLGWSFWLAIIVVPFIIAGLTVLIGIPALRIKGLYLAVATYALAFAVRETLFQEDYFKWLLPERVDRPSFLLIDFEDERSMYFLCVAALILAVVIVNTLRKSRTGRVLIGMRDNENNVRAFGINPVRMKLVAFATSGWLCGFAGVLIAHHQRAAQAETFPAQLSLDLFLYAIVGGVGSVAGIVLGGVYFAMRDLIPNQAAQFALGPVGLVSILYAAPGGLISVVLLLRDNVLKIIAQRRQMLVPSLFADMDPEALAARRIPMLEPQQGSGIDLLPIDQRYTRSSVLYGERGRTQEAKKAAHQESAALAAAGSGIANAEAAVEFEADKAPSETGVAR